MNKNMDAQDRPTYDGQLHKLIILFIMTAGSARATHFPMLFLLYGGAPFLIAYFTFLLTIAMPMMHLESNLGQFIGDGNRGIFEAVPLFLGVSYSMVAYTTLHMIGDSLALSNCLLYVAHSIYGEAWSACIATWGPYNRSCAASNPGMATCRMIRSRMAESYEGVNRQQEGVPVNGEAGVALVPSAVYHQEATSCTAMRSYMQGFHILNAEFIQSPFATVQAPFLLTIVVIWLLVFLVAHGGLLRARFFFFLMTWICMTSTVVLLLRGITLPGGPDGLDLFLQPDWNKFSSYEMWSDALYLSLESVGVTGGTYLAIVKLNHFKNDFQNDVPFVLAADTVYKGLGIFTTFLFLGHLSNTTRIDISMLVNVDSRFIVSINPHAMSIVSFPEPWSRIHSFWLISTVLPKFMVLPDIILELLSPVYLPFRENRSMAHFITCTALIILSIIFCTPGGMSVAESFFHGYDQDIRFVILIIECLVFLQIYGRRRLGIDCKVMLGIEPDFFVKFGWTSMAPLTASVIILARTVLGSWEDTLYPGWMTALFVWLDFVELSFIPIMMIIILNYTQSNYSQALAPLPTWEPDSWEEAMQYRQLLVACGLNKLDRIAEMVPDVASGAGTQFDRAGTSGNSPHPAIRQRSDAPSYASPARPSNMKAEETKTGESAAPIPANVSQAGSAAIPQEQGKSSGIVSPPEAIASVHATQEKNTPSVAGQEQQVPPSGTAEQEGVIEQVPQEVPQEVPGKKKTRKKKKTKKTSAAPSEDTP
ncbi:sodium- and chloride-dependent taurine transporter-like [Ornithodoros turicata]|uniref:sodium- and chloride-dependent taurine transporter-like n=1 Tax=Ornithodoros turicata TaxID=34597 RepID=UPI0031391CF0